MIFHTPSQVLVVQTSIQGVLENYFLKIQFGQNIFVRKYYIALYTWHDHWAEVWGKEMKYRRWSCVDFKEHLKITERKPTPNKSQIMQKFLLVQIFMLY